MLRFMGIDGGGSNLRVIIVDENMNHLALVGANTANPSIIGFDESKALVQNAMREALSEANVHTVDAVGIGIAGATVYRSRDWLLELVGAVLADTYIVPSSDDEIALVGAIGERQGILVLAGTGSIAYGINALGENLQVGGWGYLLGDVGSGYWLGLQALQLLIQAEDDPAKKESAIIDKLKQYPDLRERHAIIRWLYHERDRSVAKVATLAQIVFDAAQEGDTQALSIVEEGAAALVASVDILKRRLQIPDARIAFGGSLLNNDTLLCRKVMNGLNMSERPVALYEPVIGAALLAKLDFENRR
jgi:N-acetylglucosamine kinase-like BadF-type ATPase